MSTVERIRATIEPALVSLGLVIDDLAVNQAGKRRMVRVLVDSDIAGLDPSNATSPVPPLSLDDIADATRAVSTRLDDSDVMGSMPYVLEVSSPGVGRPLRSRHDFRRQVGRLVDVAHEGGSVTGRLIEVHPDRLVLQVPATKKAAGHQLTLALDSVHQATVQVEFKRAEVEAAHPQAALTTHEADIEAGPAGPDEEN
ncbi:ribosome maturation factor RimP [Intrasporangium calvum]|uniref:ribosome maturation factor RimP n=1 Tax=Intrasporangium calvum TaxID=53358 RepID=UPI000DF62A7C|nr:ribosome maturation factor RimP [Intrasporangium calvum]AXG15383.1 ribosome maturation factor RimP [Intrasporangium calvum]